jgi:hypothetical protein
VGDCARRLSRPAQERYARLLTPLLVMALVIAAGVLFYALTGHALAAV